MIRDDSERFEEEHEVSNMAGGPRTIDVAPDSELADLLRESSEVPLILSLEGRRFRVEPEEISQSESTDAELWADFDEARFLEGIDAAAGSWRHLDTERMKADIRRWRDKGSRPADRP
jgi:hypothetical protein